MSKRYYFTCILGSGPTRPRLSFGKENLTENMIKRVSDNFPSEVLLQSQLRVQ